MKIYLASKFDRNAEMRQVRDRLVALGHEVTSRWIEPRGEPEVLTTELINAEPEHCASFVVEDIEDIEAADMVISFTGQGGRGGRHVEFGIALALLKVNVIVGKREHIFHAVPSVGCYATFEDLEADLPKLQELADNPHLWETADER
jgi:hypothetical protein